MILQAPAKINLTLDIVGKRDDGYHNAKMLMQSVSLYDTVTIQKRRNLFLSCNLSYVPSDERNIAYRAASRFFEVTEIKGGAFINIVKRIPVAAGLAGGSTDGAVVLKGLNVLYGRPLSYEQLAEVGGSIGADIPYCLHGKTQLAEGIGEVLTPLPSFPRTLVLLAKPSVSLSTKWVYSQLNWTQIQLHPDTDGAIRAIQDGDRCELAKRMYNVLEPVSVKKYQIISEIKQKMLEYGAMNSIMSGSGPTVFGLFKDEAKAKAAMNALREHCQFVYLAHTL